MSIDMGNIVEAARENLSAKPNNLASLVEKTTTDTPPLPGYRHHVEKPERTRPKKPVQQERRSASVTMRLTPTERLRFVRWCEDRNVSLSDGLMMLLDDAIGENA